MVREKTRKLGYWESLHARIHERANGHGVIAAVVRISGTLQPKILIQALELIHYRHPLLQSCITSFLRQYYFVPKVDFAIIPVAIVDKHNDDDWQKHFTTDLDTPFPAHEYLWRVRFLIPRDKNTQDTDIVLCFHHAICDGVSSAHFVDDLLTTYCLLKRGETPQLRIYPDLPSIENLLSKPSANDDAKVKHQFDFDDLTVWKYQNQLPLTQRRTNVVYREISEPELATLTERCHEQRVSVHSALGAAVMLAARQKQAASINICLQTPINLRGYCLPRIAHETFGCYVSVVTTIHRDIDENHALWTLARDYRAQLKSALPLASVNPTKHRRRSLDRLINQFCLNKRDHFSLGFGVTNAGRLRLAKDYDGHEVKFVYGCPSRKAADFVVLLSVASHNDTLFLSFSYTEPMLSHDWVSTFADDVLHYLPLTD